MDHHEDREKTTASLLLGADVSRGFAVRLGCCGTAPEARNIQIILKRRCNKRESSLQTKKAPASARCWQRRQQNCNSDVYADLLQQCTFVEVSTAAVLGDVLNMAAPPFRWCTGYWNVAVGDLTVSHPFFHGNGDRYHCILCVGVRWCFEKLSPVQNMYRSPPSHVFLGEGVVHNVTSCTSDGHHVVGVMA